MPALHVSVVMATRDRAPQVAGALGSIVAAAQAEPGVTVEIVVVDNGSSDDTPAVLSELKAACPFALTVLSEPAAGVSRARNRGLAAARGEVIALTDDDCRLGPDYFTALAALYRDGAGPIMRGGRVELGDPRDLPFTIKTDAEAARLSGHTHPGGFIHGANMTLDRAALRLIGGFDVRFGAGAPFVSAEDTELLLRAWNAGVPIEYAPQIVVHHFHGRRAFEDVAELSRRYQVGNGAMAAKHLRTRPALARHLWWNARNAVRELFGGPLFDPELRISHRDVILANLHGVGLFLRHKLRLPSRSREAHTPPLPLAGEDRPMAG